jgi:two-component system, NarL family, nitrate/nitrite response regulator NarL
MGKHPSVLVVESHALVATALEQALRSVGLHDVTRVEPAELGDEPEVVRVADGYDVALVGVMTGDGSTTLPLVPHLLTAGCRVLLMAARPATALVGHAVRQGAEALLDKDMSFDSLVDCLRMVSDGTPLMTPQERAALLAELDHHEDEAAVLRRPFEALTLREAGTLRHLVAGRSAKEVARAEGVSIHTVRSHIRHVLLKLGVQSQREALALARHAGWPPD